MARYSATRAVHDGVGVVFLSDAAAGLTVGVAPALGAELCSLRFRGVELLHRARDCAPAAPAGAWYGHGQLLFPAVGRCRDARYAFPPGAAPRDMALHGFVSAAPFAELASGADDERGAELVCVLDSREPSAGAAAASAGAEAAATAAAAFAAASSASFPFAFRLEITFRVRGGVLRVAHRVANVDAAAGALLPFSIGNHISLAFPFEPARGGGAGSWAAGRLLSNLTHEHLLTAGSLLSGEVAPRAELCSAGGLPLTAPCATNGVLGFGPGAGAETLLGPCSLMLVQPGGISVELVHSIAPPASALRPGESAACSWEAVAASRHFVLWGEPPAAGVPGARGFICPEPWLGGPDSLNTRRGLGVLRSGEVATWEFAVAPSGGAEEGSAGASSGAGAGAVAGAQDAGACL